MYLGDVVIQNLLYIIEEILSKAENIAEHHPYMKKLATDADYEIVDMTLDLLRRSYEVIDSNIPSYIEDYQNRLNALLDKEDERFQK